MDNDNYVKTNQIIVDFWKGRFECLLNWNIRFVYDGEHWSHTIYDVRKQEAVIFPCDIDIEEDYLIHEVIKLCFIAVNNDMSKKLDLISNLVAIVKKEY